MVADARQVRLLGDQILCPACTQKINAVKPATPAKPVLPVAPGVVAIVLVLAGTAGLMGFIVLFPFLVLPLIVTGSAVIPTAWLTISVATLLAGLGTAVAGVSIAKRRNTSPAIPRFALGLGKRVMAGLVIGVAVVLILSWLLRSR